MSKNAILTPRETFEREKTRLLREAAAKAAEAAAATEAARALDYDMAELDRLTAKYNLVVGTTDQNADPARHDTVENLVDRYRTDPRSPYKGLRYSTRRHYDTLIKQLLDDSATLKIADLKSADIQRIYDGWTDRGTKKLPMAHALITMLRILANFGATVLEDTECDHLAIALHRMKFQAAKPRNERLTKEHAMTIIKKAHEMGLHSIALAQAIQIELSFRQKDVIGEWVPVNEPAPGVTDVMYDGSKWLRGLRWEEVDANLMLRHSASSGGDLIEKSLRQARLVFEELDRIGELPTRGPMIVSEKTGRPWITTEFRRYWRMIARSCGIPDTVKNMDSRATVTNNEELENGQPAAEYQPRA